MSGQRRPVGSHRLAGLLFGDHTDPRPWQGAFALLLALALGLLGADGVFERGTSWLLLSGVLAAAVSTATLVLPWSRMRPGLVLALPLLDIAIGGVASLDAAGVTIALILVVPAVWITLLAGRRGAALCALATALFLSLPAILTTGDSDASWAFAVLLPFASAGVCYPFALVLEAVEAERAEVHHHKRVADAILDTVDVGLVLLDRDGRYVTMNRRHQDFMRLAFPDGHSGRAGALGLVFAEDGTTPLTSEQMPSYRAFHGEEFDDCRIWVGDDPLTSRALSVSARTVHDERGRIAGAALAYKDVTDFMAALRVKDEFVASVSHELRTPLTSIKGYVDILGERDDLPRQAVSQLAVVSRNADRLGRLVADLLHAAQLGSAPMEVVRSRADLAAVVRDCVAAARPTAEAAGVALDCEVPDHLELMLDVQRMAQAVDNLISNAIKYTPAGGSVCVRLTTDLDRVDLTVVDTGVGIDAGDRGRLFTRFFRSRQAAERSIQGVGLGLSITKSIVESHGGRIEVESEIGQGSVFRVRLPLRG